MTLEKICGMNIIKFRKRKGYSQEKLLKAMGNSISINTLVRYETGKTGLKVENLLAICKVLEIELKDLLPNEFERRAYEIIMEGSDSMLDDEDEYVKECLEMDYEWCLDVRDTFYPAINDKFNYWPIRTLSQFLLFLPLFDPMLLTDSLRRFSGSFFGYESYILDRIKLMYDSIPDGPEKRYAEWANRKLNRDIYCKINSDSLSDEELQIFFEYPYEDSLAYEQLIEKRAKQLEWMVKNSTTM